MKVKIGSVPYIYPIPITLVGANVAGKPNFATIGDVGLIGINPPVVSISSHTGHHTNQGVLENGTFSINFPSTELLAETDYCGIISGREADKAALFEVYYGELGNAPMIAACPVSLECRVIKEFSIQHRQVFVGEVVQTHVSDHLVSDVDGQVQIASLTQLDPIIYALDNRYYRIGEPIGVGYREGRKLVSPGEL
jgi:flavin reductase (DIM6/NTAB) family NADH-FMN oxidoreductase RutF